VDLHAYPPHFNLPVLLLEHARSVSEQRHCVEQLFGSLFVSHSVKHSPNSVKHDLLVFPSLPELMLAQYLQIYRERFLIRLSPVH